MFTLCEILRNAYIDSMTPSNIIPIYERSGLKCNSNKGPNHYKIRASLYTAPVNIPSVEEIGVRTRSRKSSSYASNQLVCRVTSANQLYEQFLRNGKLLESYGTITENGKVRVCTTHGATLTSDVVIDAAKK